MIEGLSVFMPAQENNEYHELGDLAPFGDTTLLEWKISQCKEFVDSSNIYISSCSDKIKGIAKEENINYISRGSAFKGFDDLLLDYASRIKQDTILWTNVTSPFLDKNVYVDMYNKFISPEKYDLLLSSVEKKEYSFYKNRKLNFGRKLVSRKTLEPIQIATNGCFMVNKDFLLGSEYMFNTENIYLYNVDKLSSIEIKDILDYTIANDLISIYFSKLVSC